MASGNETSEGLRQRKQEQNLKEDLNGSGAEPSLEEEEALIKENFTKPIQRIPNWPLPKLPVPKSAYILLGFLTFAAFLTRFWIISHPNQVVFDEVHFGKFASYYLRRTFYFDVHPPLGKLLLAGSGYVSGYNGSYLFDKIGEDYASRDVPYIALRAGPALFGSLLVPVVFLILLESGHSVTSSFLGASMTLLDTGLTTQSRLILLDSFLIFFDIFSVLAWVKFYKLRFEPFTSQWWMWLTITGVSISLATGVKLVGLFVVALIGLATIQDLWRLLDIRRGLSMADCIYHFVSRVLALIVIPLLLYLTLFAIHFAVLSKTGPGDAFMSPPFQSTLIGNRLNQESKEVYYGSHISLVHYGTSNYLHSHAHNYPLRYEDGRISSQGQQVTGYPHNDTNNFWYILPRDGVMEIEQDGKMIPRPVKHFEEVQLKHYVTGMLLRTHDVASPLTPTHQEVTCVSEDKQDAIADTFWKIDIDGGNAESSLSSIDTKFRVIHVSTKVGLHCHKGVYGDWGFGQHEVNGNKKHSDKANLWFVEHVHGEKAARVVREANKSDGKMSLLTKFVELHAAMIRHNAALTGSHPYQSSPFEWPLLNRGISFWIDNKSAQIYLLGNPIAWWIGLFSVFLYLAVVAIDLVSSRRGNFRLDFVSRRRLIVTGGFFLTGFALHYLPFFIMGRSLFLHHYLPAVIYTYLVTANVFDFAMRAEGPVLRRLFATVLVTAFFFGFYFFAPFAYGTSLTPEQVERRKWLPGWDVNYGLK